MKIYGHVVAPYLNVPEPPTEKDKEPTSHIYPTKTVFIQSIRAQLAEFQGAGIDGIVIDELLVPWGNRCEGTGGDTIRARDLVQMIKAELASGMDLCAWVLPPDSVRWKGEEAKAFFAELFTHCRYVLAEGQVLEHPGQMLTLDGRISVDYLRNGLLTGLAGVDGFPGWLHLGVDPAVVRDTAILSLPLPKFQMASLPDNLHPELKSHEVQLEWLLDMLRWYGILSPEDGTPPARDLTAGVAIYSENEFALGQNLEPNGEFDLSELALINRRIGEWGDRETARGPYG